MTARIRILIRRLHHEEDGSLLVTALIFVTVMGLVVGAMAELASVNMRNTVNTRDQREAVYTANSAVNAAIEAFRQTPDPAVCDLPSPAINGLPDSDVTVTCAAASGSSSGSSGSNVPPLAVIALTSNPAENGFFADSSGETYIKGGMFSNTRVSMTGGSNLIVEDGPLVARNGCVTGGGSTMTPAASSPDCSIGTAPYANGQDPLYPAAVTAAPPTVPVPACPATGPVTMPAGTYTDAEALNDLFTDCATRVFHFPPSATGVGVYYFDFTNSGTEHEWLINNKDTVIVGGTFPAGFNATNITTRSVGLRCDDHDDGVQFIFGGDSRIKVLAGEVDLCAQHDPSETVPEIAVYGLDSRHPPSGSPSGGTATLTAAGTSNVAGFTNPDKARIINDDPASVPLLAVPSSGSIRLNTFGLSAIPAGSTITNVELRIRHHESVTSGNLALAGTLTGTGAGATISCSSGGGGGGSGCNLQRDLNPRTDSASVTSAFPTRASLENLTFDYTVSKTGGNASTTFTGYLDGVEVVVSYASPPSFRQQSGCIVSGPYISSTDSGKCAMIRTEGNHTELSIKGTVYAPLAPADVQLTSASAQVFNRGIIARVLRAQITGSSPCSYATLCSPFKLPDTTSVPGPTNVVFLARIEGNKRLRVLAEFPVTPGGAPTVKSWSSMNEL